MELEWEHTSDVLQILQREKNNNDYYSGQIKTEQNKFTITTLKTKKENYYYIKEKRVCTSNLDA